MSPSIPGHFSRVVLPGGLDVCGEHIPAGVDVGIGYYSLHHNGRYFQDPHVHRPERWLGGKEEVKKMREAWFPFGYGPRMCIGRRLAYMELSMMIAMAVWRFDIEYVEGGVETAHQKEGGGLEYHLTDHLTAARNGPVVRFTERSA